MTTNNAWNSNSTYADFQAQNFTGFYSWAAGAPYFDDTTLGTFKLLVGGTGYIKTKKVTWVAQNITGLTAGNCYFIYIDSTGTIGKATTRTDALFTDNIVLFECLRDSTPVTNNQVTVAENHPYDFQAQPSNYLHDVIGPVINNYQNGANITLNGTQGIQINGADVLEDHGLETNIPDSGGAAVTWIKMYTDGTGKWARQNATTTFTGYYNNAGTPTALTANRYAVYTLYVSKESLNTTTPTYFAVLNTSQYTSLTAANTAISNGTTSKVSAELQALEVAQLGYIVYSQASSSIVNVIISKSTLKQTLSTGGTNTASLVNTTTSAFNGWLSATDTNVQSCLDTLDDVLIGGTAGQVVASNGPGTKPTFQGISVLQQVRTSKNTVVDCTTVIPFDDTIPQNTEGDEVLTLTITPLSASSTLLIEFRGNGSASNTNSVACALFQDTTASALAGTTSPASTASSAVFLRHYMTSGTTSATTFKIRLGQAASAHYYLNANGSGTRYFGGVSYSTLIITEYSS